MTVPREKKRPVCLSSSDEGMNLSVTTLALGMQHKGHKDRNLPIKNKVYFNIKRKKKGL